jgi:hypothetical protein
MKAIISVHSLLFILLFTLFVSTGKGQDVSTFQKSLTELKIGNTNYFISLPSGYKIRESTEYGCKTVYYFQPPDSTRSPLFTGGIYIGDYPRPIPPTDDSCTVLRRDKEILHRTVIWIIYKCDDETVMQAIFHDDEKSDLPKLNPFVTVGKHVDLEKIFFIYSTLRKK